MPILLFLNFYYGETIKAEPSIVYEIIKGSYTAVLAALFTYTGFRIRDWLDRKKELRKMNVKFINLYEEIKQINRTIPHILKSFLEYSTKFKNDPMGVHDLRERFDINALNRINSIDKDLIFHRILIGCKDKQMNMAVYRKLFDNVHLFEVVLKEAYKRNQDCWNLWNTERDKFSESFNKLRKFVFDIITTSEKNIDDDLKLQLFTLHKSYNEIMKNKQNDLKSATDNYLIPLHNMFVDKFDTDLGKEIDGFIYSCNINIMNIGKYSLFLEQLTLNFYFLLKRANHKLLSVERFLSVIIENQNIRV